MTCEICDAQARNDTSESLLKPMSTAPLKTILAIHYEKGPMEISPDHDANWWLAYARPGVGHWYETGNEEGGMMDDGEFDGWIAESADD